MRFFFCRSRSFLIRNRMHYAILAPCILRRVTRGMKIVPTAINIYFGKKKRVIEYYIPFLLSRYADVNGSSLEEL